MLEEGENALYAPSGHLVYARGGALHAAAFDLETLQVIGPPVVAVDGVVHPFEGSAPLFTLSRNGTLAYVYGESGGRMFHLAWVDRTGREELLPLEPRPYMEPRLSPDGSRLAVAEADTDLNLDIRIYDVIRYTLLKRLTTSLSQDRGALWSPDGERIYFWSGGAAGTGLQWKDVQGDGASNLLNEFGSPQTRSPDGRTIVYVTVTPQTGYDIWTVSIDDGTTATLFDTSFSETAPAISPDGQWIAHASTESGQWEVYVSSFPDVEAGRWQVSSSGGSFPSWSPNGEELYFLHRFVLEQPKRRGVVGLGTAKWVRSAGASLVDEHDVTFAMDEPKSALHADIAFRCGLSRAAGEKHEWVRLGSAVDSGHDGDAQIDGAAGAFATILVNRERAALRRGVRDVSGGAQLARRQREASVTASILWLLAAPEHQEGKCNDLTHLACAQ